MVTTLISYDVLLKIVLRSCYYHGNSLLLAIKLLCHPSEKILSIERILLIILINIISMCFRFIHLPSVAACKRSSIVMYSLLECSKCHGIGFQSSGKHMTCFPQEHIHTFLVFMSFVPFASISFLLSSEMTLGLCGFKA
jgi:hypothetical protein